MSSEKKALLVIAALGLMFSIGACGSANKGAEKQAAEKSSEDKKRQRETKTNRDAKARQVPSKPEVCLLRAGLSQVEQRDKNLWRGLVPDKGRGVIVRRDRSKSEAQKNVEAATGIVADAARRYAVLGPYKAKDDGSVSIVADCLNEPS